MFSRREKGADGFDELAEGVAVSVVEWEVGVFGEGLWEDFLPRFVNEESHLTCRNGEAAFQVGEEFSSEKGRDEDEMFCDEGSWVIGHGERDICDIDFVVIRV